jgi:transcription antitermination factor NusG
MSWWVVQTEAQREHIVRLILIRHGFESYAPRIKIRGRITMLFPAYVFVRAIDRWYPVLWTPHVVRLLMTGERPADLKDDIVSAIRKREIGGFVKLPRHSNMLTKGQNVRISKGTFSGKIALYDGMSSRERARVLLDLLGRKVTIELPQTDIAPLDIVASG